MSAIVKTKLKNAREALSKKNYESARDASTDALSYDPENYHAYVFLGLACLELGDIDKSEQAYRKAIELNPEQLLAWQGVSKLYERQEDWRQYADALQQMAQLYLKTNDAVKCAETLQKFIDLRRVRSSPAELCEALSLWLPNSQFYPLLSTLPPPDATNPTSTTTFATQMVMQNSLPVLEEIISIKESDESATITREFEKRRTRLGAAGPVQIQKEVGREVWGISKLPELYNEILNHPYTSDDLRRSTESKLLRHRQQLLHALPITGDLALQKAQISAELQDLVNGMVLLEIPDELAWEIFIENKDALTMDDYDMDVFRKYIRLFPGTPMQILLHAYFMHSSLVDNESDHQVRADDVDHDYVTDILDTFQELSDSIIAHRIVGELYEQDGDYETLLKVAENGLKLVERHERNTSIPLPRVTKSLKILVATSLVHLFPPKHHPRALPLLHELLAEDPDNVRCLMNHAYTLQYAYRWGEAKATFDRVAELLPDDADDGLRAQEESAWCTMRSHDPNTAANTLHEVIEGLDGMVGRDTDQARCWWRLGQCYWNMGDGSREAAYGHFITALKRSSTFAPAFTSLGIYYAEFTSPPDPKRASKCFQKAFELDPREGDAARRLAEGFAEEREWDLVEVVAQRAIDGEGGLNAGVESAAAAARYLPLNAWAWKALGAVEMTRQHYGPAIQAFQIALRTDADDQLSWLRLGEVYSKAGRYEAAIKALRRAQELDPADWIVSYFLGDVERQIGQFQTAIQIFSEILVKHPDETKVLLSLAQTHLELGRSELGTFYTARAETSFLACMATVMRLMEASSGHRRIVWKVAADALCYLSQLSAFSDPDNVISTVHHVLPLLADQPGEQLQDVVTIPSELDASSSSRLALSLLETAILAYKYRASLGALDANASGSACHDIGNALSLYARRLADAARQEKVEQRAVSFYKEALALDPMNDRYWSTLATALFSSQPKTAQHAYIRALEIDARNASTWTNLGLFYLFHGDLQLAAEAFYKAQSLDPDYALAWVGRGLICTAEGHDEEGRAFFEHSIGLPAPVVDADILYATRLFSHLRTIKSTSVDALHSAFFVLDRFCKQRSQDAYAWNLFGLVCESVGQYESGITAIERAIALLEAAYEDSEDPSLERQFTIAHINLGRLQLSAGSFESAIGSLQVALGFLPEDTTDSAAQTLLAQAQLCSGVASFQLGQLTEALQFCEMALQNSVGNVIGSHAVVILAQSLWAIGTEEGRDSAKAQLLQSIEADPENLLAINALAGMGILTDDDNLVDAALSEILSLSIPERQERDPAGDVTNLLIQHRLSHRNAAQAIAIAQKTVVAHPSHSKAKQQLASLTLQSGEMQSAKAILASLSAEEDMTITRESTALRALVESQDESSTEHALRLAKRAVLLTPWKKFDWQALAYVRTRNTGGTELDS